MAFAGSMVISGRGLGVVAATATATQVGLPAVEGLGSCTCIASDKTGG